MFSARKKGGPSPAKVPRKKALLERKQRGIKAEIPLVAMREAAAVHVDDHGEGAFAMVGVIEAELPEIVRPVEDAERFVKRMLRLCLRYAGGKIYSRGVNAFDHTMFPSRS